MGLRAVELAQQLGLSKGRISQLVGEGRLNGCYEGDGTHRRFDPVKVAVALQAKLDAAQMLGNGAGTKRALRAILQEQPAPTFHPKSEQMSPSDPDRYELARSAKAEEELRAMRLRNGREEGQYVLASEVDRNVSRVVAQNLAETEAFMKEVAALVAGKMGIDQRQVRQIILDGWREFRTNRAKDLAAAADDADLSDIELAEQI